MFKRIVSVSLLLLILFPVLATDKAEPGDPKAEIWAVRYVLIESLMEIVVLLRAVQQEKISVALKLQIEDTIAEINRLLAIIRVR